MKAFGYKKSDTEIEGLMELENIGLSASPAQLRALASFIKNAADELEEMGKDFGHLHFMDEWEGWKEGDLDIQVCNPNQ